MKLFIFHFRPIEFYPPAINMLRYFSDNLEAEIVVFTSSTYTQKNLTINNVTIIRIFPYDSINRGSRIKQLFNYFKYYFKCLIQITQNKPSVIFYIESISSIAITLASYFGLIRSRTKIFAHFHEYFSPKEINKEMFLERIGYYMESNLLKKASWVSQTNHERLKLFLNDRPFLVPNQLHIMPNYPPRNWINKDPIDLKISPPLKLVYVGALSTKNMYFKELANWVHNQGGKMILHLFSLALRPDVESFLKTLNSPFIEWKGMIPYNDLPLVLQEYHIGLIIYNGASTNFIYNAPNKLFEYLACGLDVWFSTKLISSRDHKREDCYPKILEVDFQKLDEFDWKKAVDRSDLKMIPSSYFCEEIYKELSDNILDEIPNP